MGILMCSRQTVGIWRCSEYLGVQVVKRLVSGGAGSKQWVS